MPRHDVFQIFYCYLFALLRNQWTNKRKKTCRTLWTRWIFIICLHIIYWPGMFICLRTIQIVNIYFYFFNNLINKMIFYLLNQVNYFQSPITLQFRTDVAQKCTRSVLKTPSLRTDLLVVVINTTYVMPHATTPKVSCEWGFFQSVWLVCVLLKSYIWTNRQYKSEFAQFAKLNYFIIEL